ncbi:serine/threonine-protein kinase [Nocardia sp. NPDC058058]|uniref:serine/threonine-protein kinase n=1 Tax=Nocardia sp. NPDC058058 TaxID=3346317 RepID=UPI0036DC0EB0
MTALPAPGEVFAGYRIERVLAEGTRGRVYLAAHPRLPRRDVLKVLPPSGDFEFTARFVREAELIARLEHPNVVRAYDRGVERGCLWLAMAYVDGVDAGELIRRHPGGLPVARVVRIVTEVARGLDAAHRAGLVHRDVKPGNILVESRSEEMDSAYISDFGVARSMTETEALTVAGTMLAGLDYAAPELLAGAEADQRADVYGLGCTLFELLTGTKPYPASSPAALIRAQLRDAPPRPSQRAPGLPVAIDAVIARALAKQPRRRYDSAGALARAAAAALDGEVAGRGARGGVLGSTVRTGVARWSESSRRARVAVGLAALTAVVALTAGAVLVPRQWFGTSPAAPTASATSTTGAAPVDTVRSWGAYDFVVRAFPTLLPSAPLGGGFQAMRCAPMGADYGDAKLDAPLGEVAGLRCNGNGDPVMWLFVQCEVDRSPRRITVNPTDSVAGEQEWVRPSGSGRMVWGSGTGLGSGLDTSVDRMRTGKLRIEFDDAARNFCTLEAWGGASGQELVDRWFPGVPL